MTQVTVYPIMADVDQSIVDAVQKNGEIIEAGTSHEGLTSLIHLYADRDEYVFDREAIYLGGYSPFDGGHLSEHYSNIESLVRGVQTHLEKLRENPYELDILPQFYTFEDSAYQCSGGEKILTLLWSIASSAKVKRKGLGMMRGSLRGLNAQERDEFERLY